MKGASLKRGLFYLLLGWLKAKVIFIRSKTGIFHRKIRVFPALFFLSVGNNITKAPFLRLALEFYEVICRD
jgi:hypothetical protein